MLYMFLYYVLQFIKTHILTPAIALLQREQPFLILVKTSVMLHESDHIIKNKRLMHSTVLNINKYSRII